METGKVLIWPHHPFPPVYMQVLSEREKWVWVLCLLSLLFWVTGCSSTTALKKKPIKPKNDNFHFYGLQQVGGVVGVEDLTLADTTGLVFLSSDDRRATRAKQPRPGAIYRFHLRKPLERPTPLTANLPFTFHPHGISYFPPYKPGGAGTLFVINHREDGKNTVEIFDWLEGQLTHRRSVESPLLRSPNDIVGVGPNQFYFTNDMGSKTSSGRFFELLFGLPRANVGYFDGEKATPALSKLRYANGINRSADGKWIYVSTVRQGRVLRCLPQADHQLQIEREVRLHSGADNIELDEKGHLWVTCHPDFLKFARHVNQEKNRSPWEVYVVDFEAPEGQQVHRYFYHDGMDLSGASTTVVWRNRFVTGSVFEPRILTGRYY